MIPTIASRRRVAYHLDQVNVVLADMKGGAALHFSDTWFLSNGRPVDAAIAQAVTRHASVVDVGVVDVSRGLFGDIAVQTYRYVDET
jgi:hypothetical protein